MMQPYKVCPRCGQTDVSAMTVCSRCGQTLAFPVMLVSPQMRIPPIFKPLLWLLILSPVLYVVLTVLFAGFSMVSFFGAAYLCFFSAAGYALLKFCKR